MRRMKLLVGALLIALSTVVFVACVGDGGPSDPGGNTGGTFIVMFDYNYTGAPQSTVKEVASGSKVEKVADPVREGYTFSGWYTNLAATKAYSFETPVTANKRLYAGWEQSAFSVTFNYNDGVTQATVQTVNAGGKATQPAAPTRDGYDFTGWFSNRAGTQAFDFNAVITGNVNVYAGWRQEVAVATFVHYDDVTTTQEVEIGSSVIRPAVDPERENYRFDDWYTSAIGNEKFNFSAPVTGDVRIYAHWILSVATVTFEGNFEGSQPTYVKADVGSAVTLPDEPIRTGYDFEGWYLDSNCTTRFDVTTLISGDLIVYANWELATFTVTFDGNGNGAAAQTVDVKYNQTVGADARPTPERDGYVFTAWYLDKDCSEDKVFTVSMRITEDITVYAGWTLPVAGPRVVTFNLNYEGQTGAYDTKTYQEDSLVEKPTDPTRTGYYFGGWAKNQEGSVMFDFATERATASMTLYAKWLKGYTFEAEFTFMDEKRGQGSSDNGAGPDYLIISKGDVVDNGEQMGISNGYYVGKLYYNGAFLDFEINSSEEVTDAILILRLTPDLYNMTFTDETWKIIVNGNDLTYPDIVMDDAIPETGYTPPGAAVPVDGNMYKRPFENYLITMHLHLEEGANTIRLLTNNTRDSDIGGTFQANTPLIDCMYIYSSSTLSWAECHADNIPGFSNDKVTYTITNEDRPVNADEF